MLKSKSIQTLSKQACTGCKMCGDVCPKNCITFIEDEEGFFYPYVNEKNCIDCGLCSIKCPAINMSPNESPLVAISGYASDKKVKNTGSSGGVFFILASATLKEGGVVYGAAFDEQLKLKHHRVDEIGNLRPLCKSKYLQSDCTNIYNQVREDLIAGKKVIFAGTPCQNQALKNFVGKTLCEKLLLVDFVCHGVPNQKLFDENLEWNKTKFGKVKSIEFRYKGKNVQHPQTLKMVYEENGIEKSILRMHYQDPFYFGFQRHITLRPSCYQCQWAKSERCSDITLADFWGIEKANVGLVSNEGISCILLNTETGHNIFSSVKTTLSGVMEFPINFAVENNACLGSATAMPECRDNFFEDWNKDGYDAVVVKYLVSKRKWIFDAYYAIPTPIRKIIRKLMENRIKYE